MTPHVIKGVSPWQGTRSVWFKNDQKGRHVVFNMEEATKYESAESAMIGWSSLARKRKYDKEIGDYEWKIVPIQENEKVKTC